MNKFDRMKRATPNFYRPDTNTIIKGLLSAWGLSDDEVTVQIQNAKEQLFVQTAEGRFLNALGSNVGVDRTPELGMSDEDFRKLIPVMSFFPKQVRKTLIDLLDVFWGPEFTRPNVNSGNVETYNFGPETTPSGTVIFTKNSNVVQGTGTAFLTDLDPGDYIKPTADSGIRYMKISRIIDNDTLELSEVWPHNPAINTSLKKGVVRKLEYQVDRQFTKTIRFKPNAFASLTAVTIEELVAYINADLEHKQLITASVFTDPVAGDKLNIRTNTAGLQGSIQILGGDANDPARLNFGLELHVETKAGVVEVNPNEVIIRIPSSVPILRKSLKGAAHPKGTKAEIFSTPGIYDFSGLGASSTLTLTIDGSPFTVTFTHASDFANPAKVTPSEVALVINDQLAGLIAFTRAPGNFRSVGLRTTNGSEEYQITGGTANTVLLFPTTLQEDPDLLISTYPSSYIFDPENQPFTVTSINSELASSVSEGSVLSTLSLVDASDFPNQPGKFILNFGRSDEEGPIDYNSRPNNASLLIDASYTFTKNHPSGTKINFVANQPTVPRVTGEDYAVYITGTEQAREAAQALIRKLIAAGVVVRFVINFIEYLFVCTCRDCGPTESPDYRGALTAEGPLSF